MSFCLKRLRKFTGSYRAKPSRMTVEDSGSVAGMTRVVAGMTESGGVLGEFFLLGDGITLDGLALDGFFFVFEGVPLESIAHHGGFALEACTLRRGI